MGNLYYIYGMPVYVVKLSGDSQKHILEDVTTFLEKNQLKVGSEDDWNCLTSSKHALEGPGCVEDVLETDARLDFESTRLRRELDTQLQHFMSALGVNEHVPMTVGKDIWLNVYKTGHYQDPHVHVEDGVPCVFSFSYFAKFNACTDAPFVFMNPLPQVPCAILERSNMSFSREFVPPTEQGHLFIFPSFFPHRVGVQLMDTDRTTVAGNFYRNIQ